MEEIIIGLVILILIGCVFWLAFPYLLSKFKRDDLDNDKDGTNNKA